MNVLPDFVQWLYGKLSTDAGLLPYIVSDEDGSIRVYENQSTEYRATGLVPTWPSNPAYPAVRFEVISCAHVTGNGSRRFGSKPHVLIEAIVQGEDIEGVLTTLSGRIDALFGRRATGQQNTLAIQGSVAVEDYVHTENSELGVIKHLGGSYQFFVFVLS